VAVQRLLEALLVQRVPDQPDGARQHEQAVQVADGDDLVHLWGGRGGGVDEVARPPDRRAAGGVSPSAAGNGGAPPLFCALAGALGQQAAGLQHLQQSLQACLMQQQQQPQQQQLLQAALGMSTAAAAAQAQAQAQAQPFLALPQQQAPAVHS
jgi:hypothetical protein